ncbi:hypothetical protein AB0P36_23940 [Streptomyces flavidovirens]
MYATVGGVGAGCDPALRPLCETARLLYVDTEHALRTVTPGDV